MREIASRTYERIWKNSGFDIITLVMNYKSGNINESKLMDDIALLNQLFYDEGYKRCQQDRLQDLIL